MPGSGRRGGSVLPNQSRTPGLWTRGRDLLQAAADQAKGLRHSLGVSEAEPVDPRAVVAQRGWRYETTLLSADVDGEDALLIPSSKYQFTISVDPRLSRREAWMAAGCGERDVRLATDATERFRAGHELGHTIFFGESLPPRRAVPHSVEEEVFCDIFSRFLLLPESHQPPECAADLVSLAARSALSIEIVAAAVAERHGSLVVLGGRLSGSFARVSFFVGVPSMPPHASFHWPELTAAPLSLVDQGLYWPQGHPELSQADGWNDGWRFLVVASGHGQRHHTAA